MFLRKPRAPATGTRMKNHRKNATAGSGSDHDWLAATRCGAARPTPLASATGFSGSAQLEEAPSASDGDADKNHRKNATVRSGPDHDWIVATRCGAARPTPLAKRYGLFFGHSRGLVFHFDAEVDAVGKHIFGSTYDRGDVVVPRICAIVRTCNRCYTGRPSRFDDPGICQAPG